MTDTTDPSVEALEAETEIQSDTEAEAETSETDTEVAASDYETDVRFDELPLSPEVLEGIRDRGYEIATPVQIRCLEPALAGRDLIVRSKTGTGKTAAFAIPSIERMENGTGRPQMLVLCPTRELAIQVCEETAALAKGKGLKAEAVYGGASMQKQIDGLASGPEIVVGTPGRVLDHIRRRNLDLSGVRIRVLDEADEMLSMGFFEDVAGILSETPDDAQTLLFSATVSPDIEEIIHQFAHDPETILLSGDEYSVEGIDNILYEIRDDQPKPRSLVYLIEAEDPPAALIFCNTRDDTSMVSAVLGRHGLDATLINSDLSQRDRERAMNKIKAGELRFLVATDLAARGIDISGLTHVINYSLPEDPAVYMHRVGRTGRIGRAGTAISLVTGRDLATLRALEGKYGVEFDRRTLPDAETFRKHWAKRHVDELTQGMKGDVFEAYIPLAREIAALPNGEFLVAYALKSFFAHNRGDKTAAEVAAEKGEGRRGHGGRDRDRDRGGRRERGGRDRDRGGRDHDHGRGRDRDHERRHHRDEGGEAAEGEGREAPSPTRLYVGVGSEQGYDADRVRALVADAAGADPLAVDSVEVAASCSFIEAKDEDAARALLAANGSTLDDEAGTTLRVEVARGRSKGGRRRPSRRRRG